MRVTIKTRRDTAAEWTSTNPVLSLGEMGIETDTRKIKFGDGTTGWNSLQYISAGTAGEVVAEDIDDRIAELLVAGSGINLNYNDSSDILSISVSGLYASDISDFSTEVSNLIPNTYDAAVDWTANHTVVDGTRYLVNDLVHSGGNLYRAKFENESIPVTDTTYWENVGTGYRLNIDGRDIPNIPYPTITSSEDNRILTSTGTSTGINAESNLTFDGSLLSVSGDLIAATGTLDKLQLNINNGSVDAQGQIGWNSTEGTVDIALTDSTVMEIGQHRFFRIRNTTGSPLYKGQVVYASGVHPNGIITPNLYIADDTIDEIRFIGLVFDTVNDNNNGYVIDFGHLRGLDLDGSVRNYAVGDETWSNGDILYAHPTVAGKLTNVAPKHAISLAIILDAGNGNGNGQLFVRPTNFGDLSHNHDVDVSGVSNGQFLQYNSVTDYWVPSSGLYYVNDSLGVNVSSPSETLHVDGTLKFNASKPAITTNSDGATITFDLDVSDTHTVVLGDNRTLALSNVDVGQKFIIRLTQDNSGNRTVTWFSTIKWPGNLVPTLTTTGNKTDVFGFICTSSGNYDGFVIGYNL